MKRKSIAPKMLIVCAFLLALPAGVAWAAFQPRVANHFGYALPVANGLPCRIQYSGRDYENLNECAGSELTPWMEWYAKRHHLSSDAPCHRQASLRAIHSWPLREVGQVFTLLGPAHPILEKSTIGAGETSTVIFVGDGTCYRAYELLGGP